MGTYDPWTKLGDDYLNHGAFCEAVRAYTKSVESGHACCQTYRNLASLHFQRGNPSESITILQDGIKKLHQNFDKAALWGQAGDVYHKTSEFEKEHAARLTAVSLDPENVNLKQDLERFESSTNQENLEDLHQDPNDDETNPGDMQSRQLDEQLATESSAWLDEDNGKAISVLNGTITLARKLSDLHTLVFCLNLRGIVETNQGKTEDAMHSYQEALALNSKVSFAWERLGKLQIESGQEENALVSFIYCIEINPGDPVCWNNLGKAYHRTCHEEEALTACQLGDVFEHELEEGHSWLKGRGAVPETCLVIIPRIHQPSPKKPNSSQPPSPPETTPGYEGLREKLSEPEVPFHQGESQQEEGPENPEGTGGFIETGSTLQPAEPYRLIDALPPRSPDYPCWYYDNPVKTENRMLLPGPGFDSPPERFLPLPDEMKSSLVGNNFADTGKSEITLHPEMWIDQSVDLMVEEKEEKPSPSPLPGKTGSSLIKDSFVPVSSSQINTEASNSFDKEILTYKRVTEINPENDRAWDALGNMYEAAGQHQKAIDSFEKAVALNPSREVYHYHLGLSFAAKKDYEKAIEALQLVISMNMDFLPAHCAIAGYYRRVGKDSLAQRHIVYARPFMDQESEYNRACFEAICGNVDIAVKLLKTALETQQVSPQMLKTDADLDLIREEPLFKELIQMEFTIDAGHITAPVDGV